MEARWLHSPKKLNKFVSKEKLLQQHDTHTSLKFYNFASTILNLNQWKKQSKVSVWWKLRHVVRYVELDQDLTLWGGRRNLNWSREIWISQISQTYSSRAPRLWKCAKHCVSCMFVRIKWLKAKECEINLTARASHSKSAYVSLCLLTLDLFKYCFSGVSLRHLSFNVWQTLSHAQGPAFARFKRLSLVSKKWKIKTRNYLKIKLQFVVNFMNDNVSHHKRCPSQIHYLFCLFSFLHIRLSS